MLKLFILSVLRILSFTALACIHDSMNIDRPVRGTQMYSLSSSAQQRRGESGSGTSPIRLTFDTRFIDSPVIRPTTAEYVRSLISMGKNRLQKILNVTPVSGNIFVPRNCSATLLTGPNRGKCAAESNVNKCGEVSQIPSQHLEHICRRRCTKHGFAHLR